MTPDYTLETLFAQLGLETEDDARARFVDEHRPIPADVTLADAPFWSISQAAFLREAVERDGAWATPADELDVLLR